MPDLAPPSGLDEVNPWLAVAEIKARTQLITEEVAEAEEVTAVQLEVAS